MNACGLAEQTLGHALTAAVISPFCSGSGCQALTVTPAIPVPSKSSEKVEMGFLWAGRSLQKVFLLAFALVCWCKSGVSPMCWFLPPKEIFWDFSAFWCINAT